MWLLCPQSVSLLVSSEVTLGTSLTGATQTPAVP